MDRLDNEEIGIIWASHYPEAARMGRQKSLCLSLAMLLRAAGRGR